MQAPGASSTSADAHRAALRPSAQRSRPVHLCTPPAGHRSPRSPLAPTCDKVRSPIRCQVWTAATPSTSKYVKTPMYLMLRRPTGRESKRDAARGGRRRGCRRGPGHHTHPTAQEQATPVSVSQNHQRREKGLRAKQRGRAGTAPGVSQDATFLRHLLASGAALSFRCKKNEPLPPKTSVSAVSLAGQTFLQPVGVTEKRGCVCEITSPRPA